MPTNNARGGRRRIPQTAAQMHKDWLQLVMAEGPFLAVPPLREAWPQGMPTLASHPEGSRIITRLKDEKEAFEQAWDSWHQSLSGDDPSAIENMVKQYMSACGRWVDFVLRDMLAWHDRYVAPTDSDKLRYQIFSPDERVFAVPTGILKIHDRDVALVMVTPEPMQGTLADASHDGWQATMLDRMQDMLRVDQSECSIGIVTDGRWWAIVSAPKDGPAAWGQFDSQMWVDTPTVRDAFVELLSIRRLTLAEASLSDLFVKSVTSAEEITDTLGRQVRQAVELLVSAFSETSAKARNEGLEDPFPKSGEEIYEATVTVMMRIVFLLFAEERGLLPQSRLFENAYGMATVLDELEARANNEGDEAMDGTSMAWHRLIATSQALFEGATFEDMRLPAYGGSVFDPERYPFLMVVNEHGELKVSVSDRVMRHVLHSVQIAQVGQDSRRISFRDIDVEQIGYIYEGLLGYTCRRSESIILGLNGRNGEEPEMPLDALEEIAGKAANDPRGEKEAKAIEKWVKANTTASTPPTTSKMAKMLTTLIPEDSELALLAVSRDETIRDRLRPWIGLIRRDLRNKPVVFLKGDLYVTETPSRKNAGAHYTPRSLAEEVVQHALEPLVYNPGPYQTNNRNEWRHISSNDLLNLHVADIACGSGAFLVAAARYLAGELVTAWRQEELIPDGTPEQVRLMAIRKVVASCLYGVDINDMAIEMCKLSLWLVSLDRNLPFSFIDNKILHGNSLLGVTSLAQIENKRIDAAERPLQLFEVNAIDQSAGIVNVGDTLRKVRRLRDRLSDEINPDDPQRSSSAKHRQMKAIDALLAQIRTIADGVIAAGLSCEGKPGKQMDEAYDNLAVAIGRAYPSNGTIGDSTMLEGLIDEGLTPTVSTDYERWRCIHWPIEIPEVMENGGFDAIVGNPPFLGGQKLTGAMGDNIREWCVNVLAGGNRGSADLCAYFFLRSMTLLRENGTLGLLATNTIAQGATREVGLDRMVADKFTITRSVQSRPWPVSSANLEYAAVWGVKGRLPDDIDKVCDGTPVRRISTLLEPQGRVSGIPEALKENERIAFIGCYVLGLGFVIEPDLAREWIDQDPKNKEVLFPYLNGEDLNSRPNCSASRWVIDFNDRSEKEAKRYPVPYQHLVDNVREERARNNRKVYRDYWWQYAEKRPAMRKAIANLDKVLVIAQVSKTLMPQFVSSKQVCDAKLVVFATDKYSDLAVLSSAMHRDWGVKYGTSMRQDPTYVPSAVFVTFPRPMENSELSDIGRTLFETRQEIMQRRDLGMTSLYNMVNDPDISDSSDEDIARLREIHKQLDETVMKAYGWEDVPLNHGFHTYRKMTRWTVCPEARIEILDRLLEENQRRAKYEKENQEENNA